MHQISEIDRVFARMISFSDGKTHRVRMVTSAVHGERPYITVGGFQILNDVFKYGIDAELWLRWNGLPYTPADIRLFGRVLAMISETAKNNDIDI